MKVSVLPVGSRYSAQPCECLHTFACDPLVILPLALVIFLHACIGKHSPMFRRGSAGLWRPGSLVNFSLPDIRGSHLCLLNSGRPSVSPWVSTLCTWDPCPLQGICWGGFMDSHLNHDLIMTDAQGFESHLKQ